MKRATQFRTLVALLVILGGGLALGLRNPAVSKDQAIRTDVLTLRAPSWVQTANAAPIQQSVTSFLDDEAGIAAYTQAPGSIDLSAVRGEFRAIERETDDYIIGSVGIPDYSEDHDPHVYVHADGWVLAYYLAGEEASFILDLRHYDGETIASTKLENAMAEVLAAVGVLSFTSTYYDFRYPDATHIMLVAEAAYTVGDETFSIQLPGDFVYYERSWANSLYDRSHYYTITSSTLYINDVLIDQIEQSGYNDAEWTLTHGSLTSYHLPIGTSTIRLGLVDNPSTSNAFCGIALVYQEAP